MVFIVNIVSLAIKNVSMAKMTVETPKPIRRDDHKCPVDKTIFLTACQKHRLIGIANIATVTYGLSFHQSHTNCELN
jgi:hypothetical protein